MKTLRNHTIIYDDECPLCDAYTTVFIRTKMLDDNGRTPFSNYNFAACPNLDEVRACNEIALVDNSTGEITYGVNSLVKILSARFPFINRIMEFPLSQWIATRLYRFVSYNRKVIVPGAKTTSVCTPSFNTKYRISYILFACVLSALVLHLYSRTLDAIVPGSTLGRELLICGGQILFQALYLLIFSRGKIISYLGNMMTVSLGGVVLLIPPMVIGDIFDAGAIYFLISFFLVVMLMFSEHVRRVKLLELHWSVSLSWIVYRLLILAAII